MQFSQLIIYKEFYCTFSSLMANETKIGLKLWGGFYCGGFIGVFTKLC